MDYRISKARHIKNFTIWVEFRDGVSGEVDLAEELHGEIFEPLKDIDYFKNFTVHPELYTLAWANGADFAPEFLYESVKQAA